MHNKQIKNYAIHIGDLAIDRCRHNGADYIIAVSLMDINL